jgi:RNA polymerase sigma-70 factor, ECF subfamily
MADALDDEEIAEALRGGRPDQLRVAFDRHFDAMQLLARALTGRSEEDVGRVIEAAWVSAVADFPRAEPKGSVRAWLFARFLDMCERFLPPDDEWEGHWAKFPVPWRADSQDWEHSPEGRAVLEGALDALPPLDRTVVVLRDLDGWSAAEVRALTKLSPDLEREVLFRARLAIRAAIDPMLRERDRHG